MKTKRILQSVLAVIMAAFMLASCGAAEETAVNSTEAANTTTAAENVIPETVVEPTIETTAPSTIEPLVITFEKTAVQSQEVRYIPIEEVGSYNKDIITDDLLENCELPDLDKANLPYFTGYILENKISVNYGRDGWNRYTGGNWYFNEEEIKYLSENGFNSVRALYSLSFFSNPTDVSQINVSELEQLDELISWCMKYNIHLIISQTGLPGKWGSYGNSWGENFDYWDREENVVGNSELFTSEEMQKTYTAYYDMLAKRYKDIPNGVFSFELATENSVPNDDINLQAEVLGPVAKTIWDYSPDRIVIVNDVTKRVPEKLAEMGCCISLHNHFYGTDIMDAWNYLDYDPTWPLQYLPSNANADSDSLILSSESTFKRGSLTIGYEYYNRLPQIIADGNVIYQPKEGDPVYTPGSFSVDIPEGTKQIEVKITDDIAFVGFELEQEGRGTFGLISSLISMCLPPSDMPSLMINDDLTFEDVSENPVIFDDKFIAENILRPFIDSAKENGVSFIMTEVGTDTRQLTPEEYIKYEEAWLKALKDNNIGWMYNCVHNYFAPKEKMWHNGYTSGITSTIEFKNFSQWKDTCYWINDDIAELLIKFQ
jgi:hypothetical protein